MILGDRFSPTIKTLVSAGSGYNDYLSVIISIFLVPIVKHWKGEMKIRSTSDLVAKVNVINKKGIEIEDIDLEQVDKESEEEERAADDRYNNFIVTWHSESRRERLRRF